MSEQQPAAIPGDVVDQILLDAANVASRIAAQLCEQRQIDKASGALTVMAELRRLAGAAPDDTLCPNCPARPDLAAGPTVAEAAAQDRAYWADQYAGEQP